MVTPALPLWEKPVTQPHGHELGAGVDEKGIGEIQQESCELSFRYS